MKKLKLSLTIAIGAIALSVGGFFGYDAYQEATMTAEEKFFQQNLEALTNNENGEIGEVVDCFVTITESEGSITVFCYDCLPKMGYTGDFMTKSTCIKKQ